MIDSGLLKAMLDILASEALSSKTSHEKSAFMLLQIINANSDIYSTLYCYRTLAAICKSNKQIGFTLSGEILQTLTKSLGLRLGGNFGDSLT
jgi:4-hydroxy-3-methylbut-2-en-1-yl diphosphate synthase IspG/GcpE